MGDAGHGRGIPASSIREHREIIDADLRIIRVEFPRAHRILDVGAGPGHFVRAADAAGYGALALDIHPSGAGEWSSAAIPGVIGDGFRLPFRGGAFDVVRIKEVIEHVNDPLALLVAAGAALAPHGAIIAHVPSPFSLLYPVANFWDDYTHVRPLTRTGLVRLFADAGMTVTRVEGYAAGRNQLERIVTTVLGRVMPHTFRVVARTTA